MIAIGFPVSLFTVGLSIPEIQEAHYTEIQQRYFLYLLARLPVGGLSGI